MPYKFIEGHTTADVAFEATGKTPGELFESAGSALLDIMADPKKVGRKIKKQFKIKNEKLDDLMYSFLDEILFLKDSGSLVFNSCKVKIKEEDKIFILDAILYGDKINYKNQELRVDPKAVTRHKFEVKKKKDKYRAFVIIDI